MKRNLFYLLMMVCSLSIFVSCKDDDEYFITDTDVNGVYLGSLDVDAPYEGVQLGATGIKQKIYITKTGQNLVTLQLKNFVFNNIPIGDLEIKNINVSKVDDNFKLDGSGKLTLIVGGCEATISGTVSHNGNCNIVIGVEVTSEGQGISFIGLNVTVDFTGSRLAADLSSEALITDFNFNSDSVTKVVIEDDLIQFYVVEGTTNMKFKPTISVSAGATISPASGEEKDFSVSKIYTVESEDGIVIKDYRVMLVGKEMLINLDEWETIHSATVGSEDSYQNPVGKFGTSNPGIMQINDMFGEYKKFDYVVNPIDGKVGKAAQLKTLSTALILNGTDFNALFGGLIPYVTAGSLFTGSFNTDMDNPLNSTKFGIPFGNKPVTFSGWYKYAPGETYYDNANKILEGKTDQCSIYAVLYEEQLDNAGNNMPLTGDYKDEEAYIGTSSRIVMRAALADGTAKADWTEFSVPFELLEGKTYDPNKNYYLAIVCSSSAEGDYYMGAPGSVLTVDEFKVVSE